MTPPGLRLRRTACRLAICRFSPDDTPPAWVFHSSAEFYAITRTPDELSVVCSEDDLPPSVDTQVERGWRAFEVVGPIPFEQTGVISGIASPLAAAGVPVFVISTFDTDYVLVKHADLGRASAILAEHFTLE